MKRNWYALLVLLLIFAAMCGCSYYVNRSTDILHNQVQAAYQSAMQGDYSGAIEIYNTATEYSRHNSRFWGLFVRRSLLDKVNETLATLTYYTTQDNLQDLGVESARASKLIEQLSDSFFGRF